MPICVILVRSSMSFGVDHRCWEKAVTAVAVTSTSLRDIIGNNILASNIAPVVIAVFRGEGLTHHTVTLVVRASHRLLTD